MQTSWIVCLSSHVFDIDPCFCLPSYLHWCSHSAPGYASDLQTTYVVIIVVYYLKYLSTCQTLSTCYHAVVTLRHWVSGLSVLLIAYKASPCTQSIPVELPLTLEMTNESIISDMHDRMIEAATSNVMLHWPCSPFRFKAQMKDELCNRVHYLSLGNNKDIAAFS